MGSNCMLISSLLSWEDLLIFQNVLVMNKISFEGKEKTEFTTYEGRQKKSKKLLHS